MLRAGRASVQPSRQSSSLLAGRLDVMFNNAGISQTKRFLDVTEADFKPDHAHQRIGGVEGARRRRPHR